MFEPRCGVKEYIQFGCGHARLNAQITFHECKLPVGHDGDEHHDTLTDHRWLTREAEDRQFAELLAGHTSANTGADR